jgi:hypothetical protein
MPSGHAPRKSTHHPSVKSVKTAKTHTGGRLSLRESDAHPSAKYVKTAKTLALPKVTATTVCISADLAA